MSRINAAFLDKFNADKAELIKAESSVKTILSHMSRELLDLLHNDVDSDGNNICDIRYINEIIVSLRTVNKRAAIEFFKAFTGFRFDDSIGGFTKKDKSRYDKVKQSAIEFLADPHNNIWTWSDRELTVEAKPFDPKKVTKFIEQSFKKAEKEGIEKKEIIKAIMAGGLTIEELADAMGYALNIE